MTDRNAGVEPVGQNPDLLTNIRQTDEQKKLDSMQRTLADLVASTGPDIIDDKNIRDALIEIMEWGQDSEISAIVEQAIIVSYRAAHNEGDKVRVKDGLVRASQTLRELDLKVPERNPIDYLVDEARKTGNMKAVASLEQYAQEVREIQIRKTQQVPAAAPTLSPIGPAVQPQPLPEPMAPFIPKKPTIDEEIQ